MQRMLSMVLRCNYVQRSENNLIKCQNHIHTRNMQFNGSDRSADKTLYELVAAKVTTSALAIHHNRNKASIYGHKALIERLLPTNRSARESRAKNRLINHDQAVSCGEAFC